MDWYTWHEGYDGPLGERLQVVQQRIRAALIRIESPARVISICAGQGHDIMGVLQSLDAPEDVSALLVELDERNVDAARHRADEAGLEHLEIVQADAGLSDAYEAAVPADIILICGVFGSLTDEDINRTVGLLPMLAKPRAQVIWTAHRSAPGLWGTAVECFERHRFKSIWTNDRSERFGVGHHQLMGPTTEFRAHERLFSFADEETLIRIGRATP